MLSVFCGWYPAAIGGSAARQEVVGDDTINVSRRLSQPRRHLSGSLIDSCRLYETDSTGQHRGDPTAIAYRAVDLRAFDVQWLPGLGRDLDSD